MRRLSWWFLVPVLIFGWSGVTQLGRGVGRVWLIGALLSLVAWVIARQHLLSGAFVALALVLIWGPNVFFETPSSGGSGHSKVVAMVPVHGVLIVHCLVLAVALVWAARRAWVSRKVQPPSSGNG